jgi:hypothetical protein
VDAVVRTYRSCPICGREIVSGHNLSERNFRSHMTACPKQGVSGYVRDQRAAARKAARDGVGSTIVPGHGQFGFPFDGVPSEVLT